MLKPSELPKDASAVLDAEGLLFCQTGIRLTVFHRRYRAPGRIFVNRKRTGWGSLAVSKKRVLGYAGRRNVLNLPFDAPGAASVKLSCVNDKVLVMAFDPGVFNPDASGDIELRFHTDRAAEAFSLLRGRLV